MIRSGETTRVRPYYAPVPLTPLPLLYAREHLFPYASYGDTETTPVPRAWRTVFIENDFLRVEVAPELGGRVYSLFDKRLDREILFSNPVVKPARILPVWAFVSGGIEFNFPIAHSPTSIATVGCQFGHDADHAYIRVGEREARTGMEWVVELSLAPHAPVLVQRSAFRNRTATPHPWMSWTITAVRSTPETEFIHPPHRVLVHDDQVRESDWPGAGLDRDRTHRRMTALFWKPGSAPHFGAFHHDLGFGLLHLADPAALPGKKVWTYGHGAHRRWGEATTEPGLSYCEIESGPLLDQSEKPLFAAGTERRSEEFWIPLHDRAAAEQPSFPDLRLPPLDDPWLGAAHSPWQMAWEGFAAGDQPLPASPVVTGLELEPALRRDLDRGHAAAAEPLALWLAFRNRPAEALPLVASNPRPTAQRLAGLILWKALGRPAEAVSHLRSGPLADPVAAVELDELLAELGRPADRAAQLAAAPAHRRIDERRADLALARGNPAETLRLLAARDWPREHQRYVRTELWRAARRALGQATDPVPESLGEDNLARFGAYWSD